jgi:1-acyl-sn-glycerol-3-phosphate acyltransferase
MTKAARSLRDTFWFYAAFLYFGGAGLAYTCLSTVLHLLLPRCFGARLGKHMVSALFRSFLWLLRATGLARLDLCALDQLRGEPGLVIAPNHPCLLDAVFVIARVPDVVCIMKAEIRDNLVLGAGARLAGYIRNDSGIDMVRAAAREVRNGQPLLIFPEGTRTRRRPINDFKGGFALIAKHAGAQIQTVFIETDSPFLGKGWPLFRKPALPLIYRARLGRRFTVSGDAKTFVADLESYYRDELAAAAVVQSARAVAAAPDSRTGAAA